MTRTRVAQQFTHLRPNLDIEARRSDQRACGTLLTRTPPPLDRGDVCDRPRTPGSSHHHGGRADGSMVFQSPRRSRAENRSSSRAATPQGTARQGLHSCRLARRRGRSRTGSRSPGEAAHHRFCWRTHREGWQSRLARRGHHARVGGRSASLRHLIGDA